MIRHRTHSRALLLVEDNPADAEYIAELYADPFHPRDRIDHVADLSSARRNLLRSRYDIVLLDLRLPDGVGIECVHSIQSAAEDVPIVVLTGIEDDQIAHSCIAAGAQDYLSKHDLEIRILRRSIDYAIIRCREEAERRRADSLQRHLAAIVESSRDAIFSTDVDGIVTSWNPGAETIFGVGSAQAIGRPAEEVIVAVSDSHGATCPDALSTALRRSESGEARELECRSATGRPITVALVTGRMEDESGRLVGFAGVCRDVTESIQRDEELRRRNAELVHRDEQMRALAHRLNAIREEERTRISREVHDELGQLLTGIKMDLRWIRRRLEPGGPAAGSEVLVERMIEAESLVDRTIATVQRIALELRPSALDALGLSAAIRDEARRFGKSTGLPVVLHVETSTQPDAETATTIFRILQELMTNVKRHAHARKVVIDFEEEDDDWVLRLEDDGIGIPDHAADRVSLGLMGMRERAEILGGSVELSSGENGGTVAIVRVKRRSVTGERSAGEAG